MESPKAIPQGEGSRERTESTAANCLVSSFPNSICERDCPRDSVAQLAVTRAGSAMELPQQVRSQMEFGNEGISPHPFHQRFGIQDFVDRRFFSDNGFNFNAIDVLDISCYGTEQCFIGGWNRTGQKEAESANPAEDEEATLEPKPQF
jgi:hypothetical protein